MMNVWVFEGSNAVDASHQLVDDLVFGGSGHIGSAREGCTVNRGNVLSIALILVQLCLVGYVMNVRYRDRQDDPKNGDHYKHLDQCEARVCLCLNRCFHFSVV